MAGHSKWANIQHRKGAQDARRGKLFTKLIREVTVAARLGGMDAKSNPRLRAAIEKALAGNVPKDTVDRAIRRAAGDQDGQDIEEVRYEGYGPGGTAVMVDCLTDNRKRTVAEVRHVFSRCGGNLGLDGSVGYLFQKAGQLSFATGTDEESLMEAALEGGADDVITQPDGTIDVITSPERFGDVKDSMISAGFEPVFAEVAMVPITSVSLELEDARRIIKLLEMLEDLEDVQQVYSNADLSEDILAQLD